MDKANSVLDEFTRYLNEVAIERVIDAPDIAFDDNEESSTQESEESHQPQGTAGTPALNDVYTAIWDRSLENRCGKWISWDDICSVIKDMNKLGVVLFNQDFTHVTGHHIASSRYN